MINTLIEQLVEKADILIEALPYIKRFRGKEILIKYGGAAMLDPEVRQNVLQDLVFMNYVGIRPILIHGGGHEITENLKKAGVESHFINGLRITDAATMKVVAQTLGEINRRMVEDLKRFGAPAVGLSGHDAKILKVKKHLQNGDVGFVGEVVSVNTRPIKKLTNSNVIPVIYPVGIGQKGETYNVNADAAAAKIAAAMGVQKIMVLTNVRGILANQNEPESLIPSVHVDRVETLLKDKIITGGMIPKIQACITALRGKVQKAHIVDGRIKHSLLLEIFTDRGIGTEIIL